MVAVEAPTATWPDCNRGVWAWRIREHLAGKSSLSLYTRSLVSASMAATRTVPGAAPSAPLTKAQRKAAAQQSQSQAHANANGAAPLAHKSQDPNAVTVAAASKHKVS